jgi:peptide/nickel transport system ATP-binding protein
MLKRDVLLEVKGLKKYFLINEGFFHKNKQYLKAVDGVDFQVRQGETLGIVGESGCGKSTTGNLIIRLLEPTAGQILFNGVDLSTLNPKEMRLKRSDIQMIFQDPFSSLNPRMRVFDIIAEPLRTHKAASGEGLARRVYELMEVVGLDVSYARRFPHEFSGGQRQRIGIARALALRPKLVICDEPVSALDVSIQAQILNLLAKLQQEFNLTYIFIAHGLPVIKQISDQVAVMYLGKIVELAAKDQLFAEPLHPYTEGLLSAVPIPDPTFRDKKNIRLLEGDIPSPVNPPSGCRFHTRCPYVREMCQKEVPVLQAKANGHFVACHYPLENGAVVTVN